MRYLRYFALFGVLFAFLAMGNDGKEKITVGSKAFTENYILAEIFAGNTHSFH